MPEYIYRCKAGHEQTIIEPMFAVTMTWCIICGERMSRRPQVVGVNWGGLRPSQGDLSPAVKEMIDGAPKRRGEEIPHVNERIKRINKL